MPEFDLQDTEVVESGVTSSTAFFGAVSGLSDAAPALISAAAVAGYIYGSIFGSILQGDILYGSAAGVLSALAKNTTATRYLSNAGASNNPSWAQINLADGVTDTLPVGNGGTGEASFTANGVLYGNAEFAIQVTEQGAANSVLVANAGAPSFSASPTIGTSVTTPIVNGGSGPASTLSLRATSGVGVGAEEILFQVGNNGATLAGTLTSTGLSIPGVVTGAAMSTGDGSVGSPSLYFTSDPDTGIFRAAADVLSIAAGGTNVASFSNQANSVSPTGNAAVASLTSASVVANAVSNNTREFIVNLGLVSATGAGGSGDNRHKTLLYAGVEAQSGSGDVWAMNPLVWMKSTSGTGYDVNVVEIDLQNDQGDRGNSDVLGAHHSIALNVSANSNATKYKNTAAMMISGPGTDPVWNRGILLVNASIAIASIEDRTSGTYFARLMGAHTYGLDTTGDTLASAIRVGPNQQIAARNAANAADKRLVGWDGSDNLLIGDTSAGQAFVFMNWAPDTDNTRNLGGSASQWANVYGVNLAITGSAVFSGATQISLTNGVGLTYTLHRNGGDGYMYFTGDQTGFIGYVFTGVDGEMMRLDSAARPIWTARTATPATLANNNEITMTFTSNTNLRFSARGGDGTTRVANLTLT